MEPFNGASQTSPLLHQVRILPFSERCLQSTIDMSQANHKSVVPKFGSFKPKSTSKNQDSTAKESNKETAHRKHQRSRSRSKGRHDQDRSKRSRHGSHHQDRSRQGKDSRDDRHLHKKRTPSPKPVTRDEFEESDVFIVDRRGDQKNLEYGSLHRYDIPSHHRFGAGYVLGASRSLIIDREASTRGQIVLQSSGAASYEKAKRPFASKPKAVEHRSIRLFIPTSTTDASLDDDFIALRPSLKRKRGSESPADMAEDIDYRSIEGKAKPEAKPDDEDVEYATGSEIGEVEDEAQRKARETNAAWNRKAKENLRDAETWLKLIEHQINTIRPGADASSLSGTEKRSLADIRLAIYDRALKNINKDSSGYDKVVLGRLKEGSHIWETSKVTSEWSEALKRNSTSIAIRTKYLNFIQSNHTGFGYEKCKEGYIEFFKVLNSIRTADSEYKKTETASAQLYTLLRFTSFVRDTGYEELAYATWQCILEYHFFKPQDLSSASEQMESLETFWESDIPRVGEEGALGWNKRIANLPEGSDSEESDPPPVETVDSRTISPRFLPAAADEESEDPFRFVMFSDIKPVVENLLHDLPRMDLVNSFLRFMDLPSLAVDVVEAGSASFWSDPFLSQIEHAEESSDLASLTRHARISTERSTPYYLFSRAFKQCSWSQNPQQDSRAPEMAFVSRLLQQLTSIDIDGEYESLAEYHFAFQAHFFPTEVRNSCKEIMQIREGDPFRPYNAYALVEAELGENNVHEVVWATNLGQVKQSENTSIDWILLVHSRVMAMLQTGEENKAIRNLMEPALGENDSTIAEPTKEGLEVSPGQRLRVLRSYEERYNALSAAKNPLHAVLHVDCMAWLTYLADHRELDSTLPIYDKYSSKLSSQSHTLALELLHQARAEMLRFHIEAKRRYKPSLVRGILTGSIALFPHNSLFHYIQLFVSAQNRIDDRLRDAVQTSTSLTEPSLVSWCYTIAKEIERCGLDGSGATANSVRALLTKALLASDSEVKHSPLLWTLWFHFERFASDNSSEAKERSAKQRLRQVFYDGLRSLPWYKSWIEMGMKHLQPYLSVEEMDQLEDLMGELEMRIRTDDNP